ncbi:glycosyltransferase family 4 protein [Candidatus Saccharibacteria bacterium]|nr:glycosyltransferase family 4 protein [Candidatus Saccharibacteria bacterium]
MKIAIDLRPLQIGHQYRGIGAYIINVIGRFPAEDTEHIFIIIRYDNSNPVDDFDLPFKEYEEIVMKKPGEPHGLDILKEVVKRRFHRRFGDLYTHNPDVFFQPDFQLGLPRGRRMKKYVVMYDIIPLVLRDIYLPSWKHLLSKPGLGKIRRLRMILSAWLRENHYLRSLRSLRRATRILSISQATTNDLHDYVGIPREKIATIHLAPSMPDEESRNSHKPKQLNKSVNPLLYYTGGVDERRKIADLIHAFNLLNGRGHNFDLVLGGKELAEADKVPNIEVREAIMDSSYRDQIYLLGFTTQEEKTWLMEHAFVFVYPTIYEGFGLPILEAMLEGCPVITYDNSSIPEIAGNSAILLKEQGGIAIQDAVLALQKDIEWRKKLIAYGRKNARSFSWDRCAQDTYKTITSQKGR